MKILDVQLILIILTSYHSNQAGQNNKGDDFGTIFIVLILKHYWSIFREFARVALVGAVTL